MPDTPVDEATPGSEGLEKAKKRYRKRRSKLEEEFPSYLQVRFPLGAGLAVYAKRLAG